MTTFSLVISDKTKIIDTSSLIFTQIYKNSVNYLYTIQAPISQALQIPQATSHFRITIEFNIYELYQETSVLF